MMLIIGKIYQKEGAEEFNLILELGLDFVHRLDFVIVLRKNQNNLI